VKQNFEKHVTNAPNMARRANRLAKLTGNKFQKPTTIYNQVDKVLYK